jgi:hypothetical protein
MERIFTHTYHIPGTLGADLNIRFKLPGDAQLLHVSATGSNIAAAGLSLGNSTDGVAYMAKKSVGISGTRWRLTGMILPTVSSRISLRVRFSSPLWITITTVAALLPHRRTSPWYSLFQKDKKQEITIQALSFPET